MAHAGGRPPKIKSLKDLENKAKLYFLECERDKKLPYLTGFYVFLGVSHSYFYDFIQAKPQYSEAIKAIWIKFAYQYEVNMGEKRLSPAHAIFMLKNCGFSDNVNINANITDNQSLSDMARLAEEKRKKQVKRV